jgi:electron transfer flavoprotein alpha subunit
MKSLIIAEHNNDQLAPVTASIVQAATLISEDIVVLVAGKNCGTVAEQVAQLGPVTSVLWCDDEIYQYSLAEPLADLIVANASDFSHILAAATTSGKNFMPRVAAVMDVEQISDIISVEAPDTFKRPIYAGNAIATVQSHEPIKVITVRGTAFDACASGGSAPIEKIEPVAGQRTSEFIGEALAQSDRPELTAAGVVISGGRGMQNGDNFNLIYKVADKLGAAVGASRAAVDEGFVPNDMQVGQTGKIVAPELYIAVGISGQIQHLAGMKESKYIVAINKDEEAPIFQIADYGLVADLFDVLPELAESL